MLTWCGHIFCPECVLAHMTEHGGLDLEQDGIDTEQDGLDTDSDEEEGAGEGGEEDSVANCPQCGQPIHMSELRETMAMVSHVCRSVGVCARANHSCKHWAALGMCSSCAAARLRRTLPAFATMTLACVSEDAPVYESLTPLVDNGNLRFSLA